MRSSYRLVLIMIVMALAGCRAEETQMKRGPIEVRPVLPYPMLMCSGLGCDVMLYVDNCELKDASGNTLSDITVHHGDRVCFKNTADCNITVRYSTDLFARSSPYFSLGPDECVNVTVSQGATESYRLELICDCGGASGAGSSNPTVRVGEDEEGGGG